MSIKEILSEVKTKVDLDNILKVYSLNYQDQTGDSFLHEFSRTGNMELLVYLFDNKQVEKCNVNIKDKNGRTALFDAMNEEIAEFLLVRRIDYQCKDNQGKKAEEVNEYANFIINQKCNETKKKILKSVFRR
jgi:ankyrin repeat protein